MFNDLISALKEGYRNEQAKKDAIEIQSPPSNPKPGVCHHCLIRISDESPFCLFCGSENWPGNGNCYKQVLVERFGSDFRISYSPVDSAAVKMAQKELTLINKAVSNLKRSLMENKRKVRADFTHSIRKPGIIFDKGADLKRMGLADKLAPIEAKQRVMLLRILIILTSSGWNDQTIPSAAFDRGVDQYGMLS